jgi:hypothetical protein
MKQLVFVCALLVFGVAMSDAVQYVEELKTMIKNARNPNFKLQELDGVTVNEIWDVTQKAISDGKVEKALEHLKDGVMYYGETIFHVGKTVGEGIFEPLTRDLSPETKRVPKKIGEKLKKWANDVFPT